MDASSQKFLPLHTSKIDDQIIDWPIEKSSQILISEQEYLELKSLVSYWHKHRVKDSESASLRVV